MCGEGSVHQTKVHGSVTAELLQDHGSLPAGAERETALLGHLRGRGGAGRNLRDQHHCRSAHTATLNEPEQWNREVNLGINCEKLLLSSKNMQKGLERIVWKFPAFYFQSSFRPLLLSQFYTQTNVQNTFSTQKQMCSQLFGCCSPNRGDPLDKQEIEKLSSHNRQLQFRLSRPLAVPTRSREPCFTYAWTP